MATEQGIVIRTDGNRNTAWVKTERTSACESCSARDSCNTSSGHQEMEVEALNPVNAQTGNRVVIGFASASLFKATFLIYIVPILAMLAGAFAGQELGPRFNMDPSILSAIGGFLFLAISFLFIKWLSNRLALKDTYRPVIIRIMHKKS